MANELLEAFFVICALAILIPVGLAALWFAGFALFAVVIAVGYVVGISLCGVAVALFYGTPIFSLQCLYYSNQSNSEWSVLWCVLSIIWFIGWFPAIYFLHFKKKGESK